MRRVGTTVALGLMLGVLAPAGTSASPTTAAHPVNASLGTFNEHAAFPVPLLDEDQLADLEAGDVVRVVQRDADRQVPARALAWKLSTHAIEPLWVASLDPHLTVDPDLVERMLSREQGRELWYGYYKLPYPISDRHYVVESWNNATLSSATGGRAWEHAWKLANHRMGDAAVAVAAGQVAGVDADAMAGAMATPHNEGAWVLLSLPDGRSLLGYHVTSTVGGSIPDWLVLQLVNGRLKALLERVDARCDTVVPDHYTPAHEDLRGGDGAPLRWRPGQSR